MSRRVTLPGGDEFLLVDTVGFISKLPHDLIEAFQSTLEEAALADLIVIVSDASSPDCAAQHAVVEQVLAQIGADHQPRLEVMNKQDLCAPGESAPPSIPGALPLSAKTGAGVDALLQAIARELRGDERKMTLMIPFARYGVVNELRQRGRILQETHEEAGARVTVMLKGEAAGQIAARYAELVTEGMPGR